MNFSLFLLINNYHGCIHIDQKYNKKHSLFFHFFAVNMLPLLLNNIICIGINRK